MTDIASAPLKELCDEAGELIRALEPRRIRAEVISVRPTDGNVWATVAEDGGYVDVCIPGGQLSGRTPRVELGMVLDMQVRATPNQGKPGWFCLALHARMAQQTGPRQQRREQFARTLSAQGVIRRRSLDAQLYSYSIRGVEGVRRITALVPPAGRAGWRDVAGQLGHLRDDQLTVVPVGGRGQTMAQGCADFLADLSPGDADVVAIIRGGGDKAGLEEFDNADLARAIHASPVPVVTGIGHREDISLADAAAHAAFPTPGEAGRALSLVSNGRAAVARKRRETEREKIKNELSSSQQKLGEQKGEIARLRNSVELAERVARRCRAQADDAHKWIDVHLVEDAVVRIRRRAHRLATAFISLCAVLLVQVAVWGFLPWVCLAAAGVLVVLSVWVSWGPTRAVTPLKRQRSRRDWSSTQEWRDRVLRSRTPSQLRSLR
ncbi:exodeoxyribonuclease VII large subunit [Janibacter sp. Soil728]|uniref:exodeoxyribonuclease VII large subunit n=1 Tax=Janibacter sp. Soil728 TaxID=1736393 RepID=UPI0009E7C9A9|nr:exodeoxyribonuclease VII large subunit [Janibacter sp. Soil728]